MTTQKTNKENKEKMTYCLMTFEEKEKQRKMEFKENKKSKKKELIKLKEQLKQEIKARKQEIEEVKQRSKKGYSELTQEQYNAYLVKGREMAKEHNWIAIEPTDKENIYIKENIKKRKLEEKKAREEYFNKITNNKFKK